eukprot:scaffold287165_cov44-Prasinocladus_malaysianus.AAC.1
MTASGTRGRASAARCPPRTPTGKLVDICRQTFAGSTVPYVVLDSAASPPPSVPVSETWHSRTRACSETR